MASEIQEMFADLLSNANDREKKLCLAAYSEGFNSVINKFQAFVNQEKDERSPSIFRRAISKKQQFDIEKAISIIIQNGNVYNAVLSYFSYNDYGTETKKFYFFENSIDKKIKNFSLLGKTYAYLVPLGKLTFYHENEVLKCAFYLMALFRDDNISKEDKKRVLKRLKKIPSKDFNPEQMQNYKEFLAQIRNAL